MDYKQDNRDIKGVTEENEDIATINISALALEHLGILRSELIDVAREREICGPLLELLPL